MSTPRRICALGRIPSGASRWSADASPTSTTTAWDERLLSYEGHCGSGGCEWHIYASKGGCFQWVGSLRGGDLDVLPGDGRRREIETGSFAGSCEAHFVAFTLPLVDHDASARRDRFKWLLLWLGRASAATVCFSDPTCQDGARVALVVTDVVVAVSALVTTALFVWVVGHPRALILSRGLTARVGF